MTLCCGGSLALFPPSLGFKYHPSFCHLIKKKIGWSPGHKHTLCTEQTTSVARCLSGVLWRRCSIIVPQQSYTVSSSQGAGCAFPFTSIAATLHLHRQEEDQPLRKKSRQPCSISEVKSPIENVYTETLFQLLLTDEGRGHLIMLKTLVDLNSFSLHSSQLIPSICCISALKSEWHALEQTPSRPSTWGT